MRAQFGDPGDVMVVSLLSLGLLVLALIVASRHWRPFSAIVFAIAAGLLWAFGAMALFHLSLALAGLLLVLPTVQPIAERLARLSTRTASSNLGVILLAEGMRVLLIVLVAGLLAWLWRSDLAFLADRSPTAARIMTGALKAAVIVLVAVSLWRILHRLIEQRLIRVADEEPSVEGDVDATRRRARLGTLLPIVSNLLLAAIVTTALLMALASLGVEIVPLLASAGVVGVAIGFGAQTLVKDILSGVFYIFDDAFRIGEYIETKDHKGTVEAFSLRSIKLRHHRGALATIPFGELGSVRNLSRDWVIDKFTINVPYETDIRQVKRIIRSIGEELAKDPEFSDAILEPMKLQGIERFGSYAIELRVKLKTRPGRQFVIRRRALAMIRQAFEQNGITFAIQTMPGLATNSSAKED